jgi:hypothetical protein
MLEKVEIKMVQYIPTLLALASDSSSERASTSINGLSLRAPATSPDPNKKRANQSGGQLSNSAVKEIDDQLFMKMVMTVSISSKI